MQQKIINEIATSIFLLRFAIIGMALTVRLSARHVAVTTQRDLQSRGFHQTVVQQESCAIAKMTARCALYK